jgi:hypothetical protein
MRKKMSAGQKQPKICSVDVRRVLNHHPDMNVFDGERALNRAFSQNILLLSKKKDIVAALAMANSGYFKNVQQRVDVDFNNPRVKRTYNLVCNMYLDKDFQYEDFIAIKDISKYDSISILKTIDQIRVKNLWYLRKVLVSNNNESEYANISDIKFTDIKHKGEKISLDFINGYTK